MTADANGSTDSTCLSNTIMHVSEFDENVIAMLTAGPSLNYVINL